MLELVVSDTISYCKKCRSGYEEEKKDDDDDDDKWNRRLVKGCLPHRVEIQGRLDFLRFVVQQTTIELSFERIKTLYNVFCVDPVVTIEECHMFLSILTSCVRGFCLFLSFVSLTVTLTLATFPYPSLEITPLEHRYMKEISSQSAKAPHRVCFTICCVQISPYVCLWRDLHVSRHTLKRSTSLRRRCESQQVVLLWTR